MDSKRLVGGFLTISEYFLGLVINAFYGFLLMVPLILVDLMTPAAIVKYPIIFIPLISLFCLALKAMTFAYFSIFIKKRYYYRPYFWKSIGDGFKRSLVYYLIALSLLYIGLTSTWILIEEVSKYFWILYSLIGFIILNNIFYSSMQLALYDCRDLKLIVMNSMVLSVVYIFISVAAFAILTWLIYSYRYHPFKVMIFGMPIVSLFILLVQRMIGYRLSEIKKEDYHGKKRND